MIAYLAATWLGVNVGIGAALAAHYRRHNRHLTDLAHDFDQHAAEALKVAAPDPDPLSGDCDACTEYDRTFHELISELVEGMAAARVARFGDEDMDEWARELTWEDR